jgi:hypothetical protein
MIRLTGYAWSTVVVQLGLPILAASSTHRSPASSPSTQQWEPELPLLLLPLPLLLLLPLILVRLMASGLEIC